MQQSEAIGIYRGSHARTKKGKQPKEENQGQSNNTKEHPKAHGNHHHPQFQNSSQIVFHCAFYIV
mgnify:CR=1 FL=1